MQAKKHIATALILIALIGTASATTYYVAIEDPACSDSGPGTSAEPWCTLSRAYTWYTGTGPKAQEGDTVLFRNGNYGTFTESINRNDWVTYKADVGHKPVLTQIYIKNNYQNSYLIFDGFDIPDGVRIEYTSDVKVLNCKIHRQPVNITGYFEPYFAPGYGVSLRGGLILQFRAATFTNVFVGYAQSQTI